MDIEKKSVEEKETVVKDTLSVVEKETQSTPALPHSSSSSHPWILALVILIVFIVAGVVLGAAAERQYGNILYQTLSKSILNKLTGKGSPFAVEQKAEPEKIINKDETTESIIRKPRQIITPSISVSEIPPSDGDISGSEFILSFSNTRKVVRNDLIGLTPWKLKVARNEIYARHGRAFVHQDLMCYFKEHSWYTIDPNYTDKQLSALEMTNAATILTYEKEINSPLMNKDTGCR
jgi:hypothetical protein